VGPDVRGLLGWRGVDRKHSLLLILPRLPILAIAQVVAMEGIGIMSVAAVAATAHASSSGTLSPNPL